MAVTTGLGVELQGVSKRFGATAALDGIDLAIPPGQFVTLIGPSGCGKTTLLRLVAGLAEPDGGTVTVGDRAPRAAQTARQLGFVPQSPGAAAVADGAANARLLVDSGRRRAGLACARDRRPPGARSGSAASSTPTPTSCRAACSSGWRSCGPSPSTRRCC